jgi:hypothetical protein
MAVYERLAGICWYDLGLNGRLGDTALKDLQCYMERPLGHWLEEFDIDAQWIMLRHVRKLAVAELASGGHQHCGQKPS